MTLLGSGFLVIGGFFFIIGGACFVLALFSHSAGVLYMPFLAVGFICGMFGLADHKIFSAHNLQGTEKREPPVLSSVVAIVKCGVCGAKVTFFQNQRTTKCPYCGAVSILPEVKTVEH